MPVLFRDEFPDFLFPVADDSYGYGLHPARAQAAFYLFPQNGAYLVSHKPIEDAARLLSVVLVCIKIQGILQRFENCAFREIVEEYATDILVFCAYLFGDVPGDRLAFPVRVRGQVDMLRSLRRFF